MRLLIVAPDIFINDAVGNHCLGLWRVGERLGLEVIFFAERFDETIRKIHPITELFSLVRAEDILLVSYSIYDPWLDRLLGLTCRKICYFHGVTPPELLREFEPVTAELCAKSIEQFPLLKNFDLIMANSSFSAQTLSGSVPVDNIRIIPPVTADMPIFQQDNDKLSVTEKGLTILLVGRVVPHKRIEDAIDILAGVRQCGCDAKLLIVGSAPNEVYTSFLIQRTRELDVEENVKFKGMLDDRSFFQCFEQASLLLSVSRHEGFCVPVLEAMHLRVPVFVRSGTAASEVGAGAAVEFTRLDDACSLICQMNADPGMKSDMVNAGQRRVSEVLMKASDPVIESALKDK